MTEEEKKAIEFLKKKMEYWRKYMPEDKGFHPEDILLNLIQKQDTEINKLNNVIDELCNDISKQWLENPKEIKQRYFNKEK